MKEQMEDTQNGPGGRGEGISGEKGEGFIGTILKDTWIITGVGGLEMGGKWGGLVVGLGWGEKAENCNRTTTKFFFKIKT